MCRQIRRYHAMCQHWHAFWTIECKKMEAKKEKREQNRGFWSRLLGSKPTCKATLTEQNTYGWCPFCTRAQNLNYSSDEYGEDLVSAPHKVDVNSGERSSERNFRVQLLRGGPVYQDSTMRNMPSILRQSFLHLSSSEVGGPPLPQLSQIRSKEVDPGIDFERWRHARDHIIPPRSGPPPDKPLPPLPSTHSKSHSHNVHSPLISPSLENEHQGQRRNTNKHRIKRRPAGKQSEKNYRAYDKEQVDGSEEITSSTTNTQAWSKETPLSPILDKDRELPDFLPWIPSPESPRSPKEDISRSRPNFSRENADEPHLSPVSSASLNADGSSARYNNGPGRRAKTLNTGYEHVHSVYADIVYVSPKLEQRIDEAAECWMSGGTASSEANIQTPRKSQTEPTQQKGNGKTKAKARPKVQFDDHVRDDVRKGVSSGGRDLIQDSSTRRKFSQKE